MSMIESSLIPYTAHQLQAGGKILVIAPHPDDEVFGCGGVLVLHARSGAQIRVIITSSGENGGDPQVRQNESCLAAAELGIPIPVFWNLPDRGIKYEEELVQRLEDTFREFSPDIVYAPSLWEVHPDHKAVSLGVLEAARRAGSEVRDIAFYEVGAALRPNRLVDITSVMAEKTAAMRKFKSQLQNQSYDRHVVGLNSFRSYTLGNNVFAAEAFDVIPVNMIENDLLELGRRWLFPGDSERMMGLKGVKKPLVSVIIRSMDRPVLKDALASVAIQTWKNIEVIIVNAKTSAHSSLPRQIDNVSIRMVGRDGALRRSAAANVGLQEASGDYLIFLDDDDWILPSHISNLVQSLQDNDNIIAAYSSTVVKVAGITVDRYAQEFNKGLLYIRNYLPIHSVLFRRGAANGCKFDESFDVYEDWDFWLQLANKGLFKLSDTDSAIYRADLGDSQISSAFDADVAKTGLKKILEKWASKFSETEKIQLHNELLRLSAVERESENVENLLDEAKTAEAELRQIVESLRSDVHSAINSAKVRDAYIDSCDSRLKEISSENEFLARNAAQRDDYIEEQRLHIEGLESLARQQAGKIDEAQEIQASIRSKFDLLEAEFNSKTAEYISDISKITDSKNFEIERITSTLSWRLTRPLRTVRGILNRFRKKAVPAEIVRPVTSPSAPISDEYIFADASWNPGLILTDWNNIPHKAILSADKLPKIVLVIPVYNGYEFLKPLFNSLLLTLKGYREVEVLIVEDCSTDVKVLPFLENIVQSSGNYKLFRNSKNLGFVESVNKGMAYALEIIPAGKVGVIVLLNTDVEVPSQWLERLCSPIVDQPHGVASVTPMTNAGTICSFPKYLDDVELSPLTDVKTVDDAFRPLLDTCVAAPTGVGFCMAINSEVLRKIGLFDAERYGRGYGEENDWCQRALSRGFSNVLQPGLFVWHKHGGSFDSTEKKNLVSRNLKLLGERYPSYDSQVREHISLDPLKLHRSVAALNFVVGRAKTSLLVDHAMGGGANDYRNQQIQMRLDAGEDVILYSESFSIAKSQSRLAIYTLGEVFEIKISSRDEIAKFREGGWIKEVFYNNAVTFERPHKIPQFLSEIVDYHQARLVVAVHDFYPVCPSYTLLNSSHLYCGVPSDLDVCRRCLPRNSFMLSSTQPVTDIDDWRNAWGSLLKMANQILCFSESSKSDLLRAYPHLALVENVVVRPHTVENLPTRIPRVDHYAPAVLGVVGAIGLQKGSRIIRRMARIIESKNLNIRIVIIGESDIRDYPGCVTVTGRYRPTDLPDLIERFGVNFAALTSIWPETYSYVTAELMAMNLRIMAFDLGAPAERLVSYQNARLVQQVTAEALLDALIAWQLESAEAGGSSQDLTASDALLELSVKAVPSTQTDVERAD